MTAPGGPLLHEAFPALRATLPFRRLGRSPTPVRALGRLGTGRAALWLKDDGGYGEGGWGGNKVRKLEWLLPDARRRDARTILTVGALGTNWGLAVALYGRDAGLRTALALVDQPLDDHVRAQLERLRASGARLHLTRTKARTIAAAPWLVARHARGLRPPYLLPAGGSSAVGALGYVEAALELAGQVRAGALPAPSHVVVPVGSGGTAAGLALGLAIAALPARVVGIVVNDSLRLDQRALLGLAGRTARLLRRRGAGAGAERRDLLLDVHTAWLGPGYGHATPEARRAQARAAEREGLDLEPVYTAKAMAALLALEEEGALGEGPAIFLNTYGPR